MIKELEKYGSVVFDNFGIIDVLKKLKRVGFRKIAEYEDNNITATGLHYFEKIYLFEGKFYSLRPTHCSYELKKLSIEEAKTILSYALKKNYQLKKKDSKNEN